MDGDTRGGAALSIKAVTGKPILFVGMGEKLSDLEQFYPERMASRILGMGDVMSLIEKAEAALDQDQAAEMQKKLKKMDFDFNDYLTSMEQMNKMGGIGSILNLSLIHIWMLSYAKLLSEMLFSNFMRESVLN